MNHVSYTVEERVGYLTLCGAQGNKMTKDFLDEICGIFQKKIWKSRIQGLIIMGEGRHFSSGADVEQLIHNTVSMSDICRGEVRSYPSWFLDFKQTLNGIAAMNIPAAAGVTGVCIGSGLELALACGIRICADSSRIGFPESTFGLLPGAGGTLRAAELMGSGNALLAVLEGNLMKGTEAVKAGLFQKSCSKKEVKRECEAALERAWSMKTQC
ncbi:MAG: enoyl-CoA hydratase/isomerase family protein [Clostridia bacterium]